MSEPEQRFEVHIDGKAVPVTVGPDDRIKLPTYAQWRRALLSKVGNGDELWDAMLSLVRGESAVLRYPKDYPDEEKRGQPVQKAIYSAKGYVVGYEETFVPVPPAVRLKAATELRDMAFGKPVVTVVDAGGKDNEQAGYLPPEELPDEEMAVLRLMAKRRMLGRGRTPVETVVEEKPVEKPST